MSSIEIKCSVCQTMFIPAKNAIKRCDKCRTKYNCEHNKQRNKCKECGGSSICEHDKRRSQCKECGGSGICEHDKIRSRCKECGGGSICEHDKIRSQCKECGGSGICEHDKIRSRCKECGGGSICEHDKIRSRCIICSPNRACQNCFQVYAKYSKNRFKPYCFRCYCILNPDVDIPRKYKLKEHHIRDFLKQSYPEINMIFDKALNSKRRPDVLIKKKNFCIVIEIDENQHQNYTCEELRNCQIYNDLNMPVYFIRFNPDTYYDTNKKYSSCFKFTKTGQLSLEKIEYDRRTNILKNHIDTIYGLENIDKEICILELFYNQ